MIYPNSQGRYDLDAITGDEISLSEAELQIQETFPAYVIDGIELTENQSSEYESLLEDCNNNSRLCKEVWRLMNFSDGEQWLPMDTLSYLETDGEFMGNLSSEPDFGD